MVSPRSGRLVADRDRLVACATLFQTRSELMPANKVNDVVMLSVAAATLEPPASGMATASGLAGSMVETMRESLLVLDGQLRVECANRAFYRAFRVNSARTVGVSIFELGNRQLNLDVLRGLLPEILPRKSGFHDLELPLEVEPGQPHTFLVDADPLLDHGDKILLCLQDITGVPAFQTELHRSERRYRRLFESAKDGVLILDPATMKILDANPFMTELLGVARDELLGRKLFEIGLLPDAPTNLAWIQELRGPGARRRDEASVQTKTAARRVVEMISNLYQENGHEVVQCNIRDVTERRREEEQLAGRADLLEHAVAERTTELTAANRRLEAFIYTVAHDLRAPLRSMQGFAAMLVEEAGATLSRSGQDFAHRIRRSAHFMDTLLGDLLTFSRVSQQRLELVPVELATVVRSVLARLENEIKEKHAQVVSATTSPRVLAHEPALDQVISNLLDNALKFTAPGQPPRIRVHAEDRGRFVRVWIEDNGIGIAPGHQEQVFRPFTRLNGGRYAGTGIGLAIVRDVIEHLGGNVGVASAPGQGSRFWFELPKA